VEADAHLCKDGDAEDEEKTSDNGVVATTESSAPEANDISTSIIISGDLGVKNEETLRAPNGKANKVSFFCVYCLHSVYDLNLMYHDTLCLPLSNITNTRKRMTSVWRTSFPLMIPSGLH
jgi:hypothetical protein